MAKRGNLRNEVNNIPNHASVDFLCSNEFRRLVSAHSFLAANWRLMEKRLDKLEAAKAKDGLENYCFGIRNSLRNGDMKDKLGQDKEKIEAAVNDVLDWLRFADVLKPKEFEAKQKEIEEMCEKGAKSEEVFTETAAHQSVAEDAGLKVKFEGDDKEEIEAAVQDPSKESDLNQFAAETTGKHCTVLKVSKRWAAKGAKSGNVQLDTPSLTERLWKQAEEEERFEWESASDTVEGTEINGQPVDATAENLGGHYDVPNTTSLNAGASIFRPGNAGHDFSYDGGYDGSYDGEDDGSYEESEIHDSPTDCFGDENFWQEQQMTFMRPDQEIEYKSPEWLASQGYMAVAPYVFASAKAWRKLSRAERERVGIEAREDYEEMNEPAMDWIDWTSIYNQRFFAAVDEQRNPNSSHASDPFP